MCEKPNSSTSTRSNGAEEFVGCVFSSRKICLNNFCSSWRIKHWLNKWVFGFSLVAMILKYGFGLFESRHGGRDGYENVCVCSWGWKTNHFIKAYHAIIKALKAAKLCSSVNDMAIICHWFFFVVRSSASAFVALFQLIYTHIVFTTKSHYKRNANLYCESWCDIHMKLDAMPVVLRLTLMLCWTVNQQ